MKEQQELVIKSALDSWYSNISRVDNLLDLLTDDQLQQPVAPNRNRGVYLLGHLTAVHDRMLPLLNLDKQHYPQLDDIFITKPDRAVHDIPSTADLRHYWKRVNEALARHFRNLEPADWFMKHSSVSEEDFAKEPHRNRLNVAVSRTNHLSYHFGQLVFLK